MATERERNPKCDVDACDRMKEHLRLLRMALGMTQSEFGKLAGVTSCSIGNAENHNGAFTMKTYYHLRWKLDGIFDIQKRYTCRKGFISDSKAREYDRTYVAYMIYEILIANPSQYSDLQREGCELHAKLIAPTIYLKTLDLETINKIWDLDFADRFGVKKEWNIAERKVELKGELV